MLNTALFWLFLFVGKSVSWVVRLLGKGGGSALPGLVVEKLYPGFLKYGLDHLEYKPIVVSGTNGKTTTTKLLTEILRSQDKKVFTNPSGSNFTRGIASELISSLSFKKLKNQFDVAVLELDEAYAQHFAAKVDIGIFLVLNISRDQLDRFGEVDSTRKLLEKVASVSDQVILNAVEPAVSSIADSLSVGSTYYFSASELVKKKLATKTQTFDDASFVDQNILCVFDKFYRHDGNKLKLSLLLEQETLELKTNLQGVYNGLNLAAAISAAKLLLGDNLDLLKIKKIEQNLKPAWGRSQEFIINSHKIHLILVKNPTGFAHALTEFAHDDKSEIIFGLNDQYADGRDVSWIWDVDFSDITYSNITTTGDRAYDMALRLSYDDHKISEDIETDFVSLLKRKLESNSPVDIKFFATYTIMTRVFAVLENYQNAKALR